MISIWLQAGFWGAFADNPKDFQSPNHIFNFDALGSQLSIEFLFCFAQPVQFAVFLRQNHIRHLRWQAPISQISAQTTVLTETDAAQVEQFIVVRLACAEKCCCDLFAFFINDKLRLQSVSLTLAAVKPLLFFFGRSIKLSVTSTIAHLIEFASSSRFLPGKENLPDLIKISSILRTSRETFDSCSPQSRPK